MGHSRTFIVKSSVILNALRVEGVMDDSVVKPKSGKPISLEFPISSFNASFFDRAQNRFWKLE